MGNNEQPLGEFSERTSRPLEIIWELLGDGHFEPVHDLIQTIQQEKAIGIKSLMALGREHFDIIFGSPRRVAIMGQQMWLSQCFLTSLSMTIKIVRL
ncbi:MAG: hypothetical protein ACI9EW_002086 [Cellvibrionaceae bacterium]|jgi:hypothetical protein